MNIQEYELGLLDSFIKAMIPSSTLYKYALYMKDWAHLEIFIRPSYNELTVRIQDPYGFNNDYLFKFEEFTLEQLKSELTEIIESFQNGMLEYVDKTSSDLDQIKLKLKELRNRMLVG